MTFAYLVGFPWGELGQAPQAQGGGGHLYLECVRGQLLSGGKRKLHTHWPGLTLYCPLLPRAHMALTYSPSIGLPCDSPKMWVFVFWYDSRAP